MFQNIETETMIRRLKISDAIEWILRFMTIAVTCVQFVINHKNQESPCVKQPDGVLATESKAVAYLIVMQFLKVIVFSIWSIQLVEPDW